MWEKVKTWFKDSVTIVWARIVSAVGVVLALVPNLTSDANINNAIHTVLKPQFIPWYVIAIGVITELARRRTAGK